MSLIDFEGNDPLRIIVFYCVNLSKIMFFANHAFWDRSCTSLMSASATTAPALWGGTMPMFILITHLYTSGIKYACLMPCTALSESCPWSTSSYYSWSIKCHYSTGDTHGLLGSVDFRLTTVHSVCHFVSVGKMRLLLRALSWCLTTSR